MIRDVADSVITLDPDSWDIEQPDQSDSNIDLGSAYEIEQELSMLPRMIDAALALYKQASGELPDLKRTLRFRYAEAYERHAGKGTPRARLLTERDVREDLRAVDDAKQRVEVAVRTVQVLQDRLSAAQTRANMVMAQMRLAK